MNCFAFRIRKRYFDLIVNGEKTVEYRRDIPFWRVRIVNLVKRVCLRFIEKKVGSDALMEINDLKDMGIFAVFSSGRNVHRREVLKIERIKTPKDFSNQGKQDVDTEFCWAFHLGKEVF